MKKCYKCQKEKSFEEFGKNSSRKDGLQGYCKSCKKPVDNNYSQNHKEIIKKNNKLRVDKIIKLIYDYKSKQQCAKCKDSRYYVLDFHHLDPSKKLFGIADLFYTKYRELDIIEKEISKCIVLCSNCHREFHYYEHYNNININEYLNKEIEYNLSLPWPLNKE